MPCGMRRCDTGGNHFSDRAVDGSAGQLVRPTGTRTGFISEPGGSQHERDGARLPDHCQWPPSVASHNTAGPVTVTDRTPAPSVAARKNAAGRVCGSVSPRSAFDANPFRSPFRLGRYRDRGRSCPARTAPRVVRIQDVRIDDLRYDGAVCFRAGTAGSPCRLVLERRMRPRRDAAALRLVSAPVAAGFVWFVVHLGRQIGNPRC